MTKGTKSESSHIPAAILCYLNFICCDFLEGEMEVEFPSDLVLPSEEIPMCCMTVVG